MAEDRSVLSRSAPEPTRTWRYGDRPDQVADIYLPRDDATGTPVLLIHGGYWRPEYDRTHLRPMAAGLAAAGHPTVLTGYARVPGDPDAAVADLRLSVTALSAGTGLSSPVLVGHSAGGHLALVLAADRALPVRACLALAPVADLSEADRLDLDAGAVREFLGGAAHHRPDLDPVRLDPPAVPVTVIHGEADTLVPPALSAAYAAATGARLVPLPGIAHFEVIDPESTAWPVVLAELRATAAAAGIE